MFCSVSKNLEKLVFTKFDFFSLFAKLKSWLEFNVRATSSIRSQSCPEYCVCIRLLKPAQTASQCDYYCQWFELGKICFTLRTPPNNCNVKICIQCFLSDSLKIAPLTVCHVSVMETEPHFEFSLKICILIKLNQFFGLKSKKWISLVPLSFFGITLLHLSALPSLTGLLLPRKALRPSLSHWRSMMNVPQGLSVGGRLRASHTLAEQIRSTDHQRKRCCLHK